MLQLLTALQLIFLFPFVWGDGLLPKVTRATLNGTALAVGVHFLVHEPTENSLYGLSGGGLVFRIDASSLAATSLQLTSGTDDPNQPVGLHVDDTNNRLYPVFLSNSGTFALGYIINTTSFTSLVSPVKITLSVQGASLASTYYAPVSAATRVLGIYTYQPNTIPPNTFSEYNVAADTYSFLRTPSTNSAILTAVSSVAHDSPNDKLLVWSYYDGSTGFPNYIAAFESYSGIDSGSTTSFNNLVGSPALQASVAGGNLKFLPGPHFMANTSFFVPYRSTTTPTRQGSAVLQFSRPTTVTGQYIPKSIALFPNENNFQSISVDEGQSVMFLGNFLGEIKKYRFSDVGLS